MGLDLWTGFGLRAACEPPATPRSVKSPRGRWRLRERRKTRVEEIKGMGWKGEEKIEGSTYMGQAVAPPGHSRESSSASHGAERMAALISSRSRFARRAEGLRDPDGRGEEVTADGEGEGEAAATRASAMGKDAKWGQHLSSVATAKLVSPLRRPHDPRAVSPRKANLPEEEGGDKRTLEHLHEVIAQRALGGDSHGGCTLDGRDAAREPLGQVGGEEEGSVDGEGGEGDGDQDGEPGEGGGAHGCVWWKREREEARGAEREKMRPRVL